MRTSVYVIVFLLLRNFVFAQTFTVGSTCCNYHLVNQTYTIPPWCNCCPSTSFSYSIDIDGDLQKDIEIGAFHGVPCFSGGSSDSYVYAKSFGGAELVYTTLATGCPMTSIVQKLNYGTPLNASLNWSATPTSTTVFAPGPYLYINSYTPQGSWTCGLKTTNHYIGFRKILLSTDTIYGWVNVDSNSPIKIIDYAYTCGSYTGTPTASTITTSPSTVQKCDSVLLNATPPGGSFYGLGVKGSYFSTTNLAAGVYTVNYAIPNLTGCTTAPSSVVFTVTSAAITNTQTSICVGESLTLTANPVGGVFTGSNVVASVFTPTATGVFKINYNYSITASCTQTASVTFTVDACVGIKNLDNINSSVNIYPNPTSSTVWIELAFDLKSNLEMNLITVDGRKIKTSTITNKKTEMDVSDLSNGIYLMEMRNNELTIRRKIIISH